MLANPEMFDLGKLEWSELEQAASEKAAEIDDNGKANFAIGTALQDTDWLVPKYIAESLVWLAN